MSPDRTPTPAVMAMSEIAITGNIIPMIWFKRILHKSGRPHLSAIIILADIVYWYRPREVRDEQTGQVVRLEKRFDEDMIQRSYSALSTMFGIGKDEARNAVHALEEIGVVKRHLRTIDTKEGIRMSNVLYIELIPERLKELTHGPSKTDSYGSKNRQVKARKPTAPSPKTDTNTKSTTKSTAKNKKAGENPVSRSGESVPPTTPQPPPAPLATPLIERAEQVAEAESFDGPKTVKAITPPRLTPRRMLQKDGPHFKQSDVGDGDYFPAGKGTNPVQIYFERFSPYEYKLSDPQQYDMVNAITNLDLWREAVTAWDNAGFKGTNRKGISDWYKNPSRFREPPTTYANGAAKPATAAPATPTAVRRRQFREWLLSNYHTDQPKAVPNRTVQELEHEFNEWSKRQVQRE